ncbi:TRAP transporter small permease [Enterovirga sp. CN4-39]|uniref:TRAP transporter small permease n=1 Tax=Enterovirga sp. CN4-39 TaxID=3400910 RepID=UPI003C09E6FE
MRGPSFLTGFLRAIGWMNVGLRHLAGATLGVMVLIVGLQIAVRFALPPLGVMVSVPWSEELARYLMIWCIFLGAAVAARSGALIAVDSLPDALPERWGDLLRLAALVITIAFFGLMIWLGWRWVEFGETETSTVMNMPMAWVYFALPAGSVVAILNILAFIVEHRITSRTPLVVAPEDNPEASLV